MYYNIFKNRIAAGGYQLTDIQRRIKKLYALGDLTEEQTDELITLSQKNAAVDMERPEVLQMLRQLADRVGTLEKLVMAQGDTDTEKETAQYESWEPWDGISNKYQYGAVVFHNGKLWVSEFDGQNVWEPGAAGTEILWSKYNEEVVENV